jgi:hypothetical protein
MALTNAGTNLIASLLVGAGGTPFNNGNAYIGVGDSSTAFSATQTDLQASSNKYRQVMDVSFPTIASNVLVFQITVNTSNANFAWNEWGVFNASTSGTMLNRVVESLGTKANTQSWQFNVTITVQNS